MKAEKGMNIKLFKTLKIESNYTDFTEFYDVNKVKIYHEIIDVFKEFLNTKEIELSLKIEATIKGLDWNSDFTFNVINDTRLLMSDILPYYIENEMYEKCSDIRNLYISLEARNSKFKKNCNKDK
jgi:hypothetical protein